MKFNCTKPCQNCPYRKDAPLALWDRQEFLTLLQHDKELFGKVYGCHKNDKSICRGFLMDQDRRNIPNMAVRLALLNAGVTRVYMDALTCPSGMYSSIEEMAEANFLGICQDALGASANK